MKKKIWMVVLFACVTASAERVLYIDEELILEEIRDIMCARGVPVSRLEARAIRIKRLVIAVMQCMVQARKAEHKEGRL